MNQVPSAPTGAWKTIAVFTTISLLALAGYTYQKTTQQTTTIFYAEHADQELATLPAERVQVAKIIEELRSENLISNKDELSLRITNETLFVNGVKQPVQLHQRVLQKYIKNPKERLHYTYTTSVDYN